MQILFFARIVIGCSSFLTLLVVKSFGKISKISFPKFFLPKFPRMNFDWIKFRKKEKISAADYDFVIEYENGNPNPKLVPKKKEELATKGEFPFPLTKNNMVMFGVVVAAALVGYYVMKKVKK